MRAIRAVVGLRRDPQEVTMIDSHVVWQRDLSPDARVCVLEVVYDYQDHGGIREVEYRLELDGKDFFEFERLDPPQARTLAAALNDAADHVEALEKAQP